MALLPFHHVSLLSVSFSQLEQWRSEPSFYLRLFLLQGHRVAPSTCAGDKASCHRSWLFLRAAGCPAAALTVLLAFCIIHDATESGHSQKLLQPLHCCPSPCRWRVLWQHSLPGWECARPDGRSLLGDRLVALGAV